MLSPITEQYAQATRRLFLLDYDGTLVPLAATPSEAAPPPNVLQTLRALCKDPRNTVVIISGRDPATLDEWLGDLPLAFVAEHGAMRRHTHQDWREDVHIRHDWRPAVQSLMQAATDLAPGSILESKKTALVWHYRQANSKSIEPVRERLLLQLQHIAPNLDVEVKQGNKAIEVQQTGIDKGSAAKYWLDQTPWDFVLAAGDDTTDENLFTALPSSAFTIKIGRGTTSARSSLSTPVRFVSLLKQLAELSASYRTD